MFIYSDTHYLVTGGLDDTVRVWQWEDSEDGSGGGQVSGRVANIVFITIFYQWETYLFIPYFLNP